MLDLTRRMQGLIGMTAFMVAALAAGGAVGVLVLFVLWQVAVRGRRVLARARRRVADLQAATLPPGARREAALLRRRLGDEVRSARETLAAPDGHVFLADSASVLAEILATATELDAALASILRFPDPAQQRTALGTVAPQVEQLIATAYQARQTMLRTTAADRARQLTNLSESVAHQAAALDAYQSAKGELTL